MATTAVILPPVLANHYLLQATHAAHASQHGLHHSLSACKGNSKGHVHAN